MTELKVLQDQKPPEMSSTIGDRGKRKWVYSDIVRGRFIKWRDGIAGFLIIFYLAAPWITMNGHPVLRFDIPGRKFHIFGGTFVATDLFLLALFMLIALVTLFWFSAVFGRLWCGWACPQTVYLEGVFRRVERWIEGKPAKRKQLDAGERDDSYWTKKISKHLIFWGMSTALALSFTAYFIGPEASYAMFYNFGQEGHRAAMVIAVVTTLFVYLDFAWFREQFCHFLCPYARIQSVFLDDDSLIIGYDPVRGEPRGRFRPNEERTLGDCIDCMRCVQVCPAGIDIRDGLQLECVQCTACIDACDHVMERIGKPHGLVRYDSVSGIEHRKRRVLRPRVIIYTAFLIGLIAMLGFKLAGRSPVLLAVVRQPGTPYVVQDDGRVRNILQLNLTNTMSDAQVVDVRLTGIEDADLTVPGAPFTLQPGERISSPAFVMVPREHIHASSTIIDLQLVQDGKVIAEREAKFLGPIYHEDHDEDDDDHDQHEKDKHK